LLITETIRGIIPQSLSEKVDSDGEPALQRFDQEAAFLEKVREQH